MFRGYLIAPAAAGVSTFPRTMTGKTGAVAFMSCHTSEPKAQEYEAVHIYVQGLEGDDVGRRGGRCCVLEKCCREAVLQSAKIAVPSQARPCVTSCDSLDVHHTLMDFAERNT
jgi:hypothetical protein